MQAMGLIGGQAASAGSGGLRTRAEARAEVLGRLTKATSDATLRREELTKASGRSTLQQLTAPVSGSVANLAAHSIGGMVEAAEPIMVIVPDDAELVVEAKLPNRERGFVSVGQAVAVKLEAFPFTRYGTVPATIESIGSGRKRILRQAQDRLQRSTTRSASASNAQPSTATVRPSRSPPAWPRPPTSRPGGEVS